MRNCIKYIICLLLLTKIKTNKYHIYIEKVAYITKLITMQLNSHLNSLQTHLNSLQK